MKNKITSLLGLFLITAAVGLISTGCASKVVSTTPVVTTTPIVTTTPVVTETVTNNVTLYTTNFVNVTNFVTSTNLVVSTNYVANTTVTSLASTSQALTPVITAVVPQPFGDIAGWLVGLAGLLGTTIAGGIASYKNSQANLHQSTLTAVVTGVENALPGIQQALTTQLPAGVASAQVQTSLNQAAAVLGAVKQSITSATAASGTHANLNATLASAGIGPTAS